jgi:LCP family protein required for cell wall assembly
MDLVSLGDNRKIYELDDSYIDEAASEPEAEESAADIIDSPKEEIDNLEEKIRKNMEDNQTPIINDKDVTNILLIGCDTRKKGGSGRSDAMILVSINKKDKTITVTSILRDIYLQIPGKKNNRINAAYAMGGASLLMDTIEQNFKIKVDRFASVDFYAFIDIVDTIGGITLDVTEKEISVINRYIEEMNRLTGQDKVLDKITSPGTYLLNGKQTLGYVRNRYVGTDFARTARQREVLEKIFNGVKDLNLIKLNELMNKILPQVTTNLTEGEIFSMILSLPSYATYELQQWSIPMKGTYSNLRINKMSVLGIDFEENIKEIQRKIYGIE